MPKTEQRGREHTANLVSSRDRTHHIGSVGLRPLLASNSFGRCAWRHRTKGVITVQDLSDI